VIDGVDVRIWIPDGVQPLRAVLVNPADVKVDGNDAWTETARSRSCAVMGLLIRDMNRNNRPRLLQKVMEQALDQFATKHNHPELRTAPLLFAGMSKGGGWSAELGQNNGARTVAFANVCGWVARPNASLEMPGLIVIGAVADGFKMLDAIDKDYWPGRAKAAPWSLATQAGCAHDYGNANALVMPFFAAMLDARAGAAGEPLKPVPLESGWLADPATMQTADPKVFPYADYPGDKAKAIWLPNASLAATWRAFVVDQPKASIQATTAAGASLPPARPKVKRTLIAKVGEPITLRCDPSPGLTVTKVEFFAGDQLLGTAAAAPWEFAWNPATPGPHAIHARWTTADATGCTSPALVVATH
jgi:hypothetical protein